jgi:Asp-tRNA(Asn)/Glu-tRNA(Gln) amidotransferase A subunit family amidase
MERYYREHRTDFSLPVRVALVLARHLSSRDYVHAQRWRTRLSRHFDHAFEACDVLVSPTTAITAPPYLPDTFPRGESHLFQTSALMRFIFPMNFTGAPAISFPAGYDAAGLPIGLHATARPWEEHVLFRLAEIADGIVEKRAPKVHYRLLPN